MGVTELSHASRMMRLFEGYRGAHGTHGAPSQSRGVKVEIKKTASTVREPVTERLWEMHLSGDRPLGIVPINEESMCRWGCIDIDKYDIQHTDVIRKLAGKPLLVCRSKSGGVHVFVFFSDFRPASEVRESLRALAAASGWGGSEIFPKQSQLLAERNDVGNWLNMPYLGGDRTERYCVKSTGLAMSLEEFLDTAEASAASDMSFAETESRPQETLSDGPPCLQHMSTTGFPDGTRNSGLFALGIYAKMKYGENWRTELERMNREYMQPPLESDEVLGIQQRLEKKDYRYSCKDEPLCSFCDSSLCRTRRFGVGNSGHFPEISGLAKLQTDPPIWFADIQDTRVELETTELQEYRLFQRACMEQLNTMFMPLRAEMWAQTVGEAMGKVILIEAPREMSTEGHFMEILERFCRDRHRGERWADIFDGRPYFEEETRTHWFRLMDLMAILERQNFRKWGRNKIGSYLKDIGGQRGHHIEGKFVRLFYVADDVFDDEDPDTELPERGDPL